MNARTLRRALERKQARQAEKQARKEQQVAPAPERESLTADCQSITATLEQLQANRRNAQLSTGPRTEEGKSVSSRNALKTGLTGRTVLLPSEDAALYEHHVASFFAELHPIGDRETELTQSIADSKWRLARIPSLEFGIYALGRMQFAEEFSNHPPAEAAALIEAKTFLAYQRQLNNLSIQESRLRRQCEKDTAELKRLQELRAQTERAQAKTAVMPQPSPEEVGFEFSDPSCNDLETDLNLEFDCLTHPQAA